MIKLHNHKSAAVMATAAVASGVLVSTLVMRTSSAAFTASDTNAKNAFATGAVQLTDDAAGSALFSTDDLAQGRIDGAQTVSRCITVTLKNTLATPRNIHFYVKHLASTSTTTTPPSTTPVLTSLAPYLSLTVESADLSGPWTVPANCMGTYNVANSANFKDMNPQSLLTNTTPTVENSSPTLDTTATAVNSYATGLTGWDAAVNGARKVYRITATVQDTNAAQALNAAADFIWEAK